VEYICLSYVWGGRHQHISRLGDTLFRVPDTIRDAIEVAKMLGVRYLWADSVSRLYSRSSSNAIFSYKAGGSGQHPLPASAISVVTPCF